MLGRTTLPPDPTTTISTTTSTTTTATTTRLRPGIGDWPDLYGPAPGTGQKKLNSKRELLRFREIMSVGTKKTMVCACVVVWCGVSWSGMVCCGMV